MGGAKPAEFRETAAKVFLLHILYTNIHVNPYTKTHTHTHTQCTGLFQVVLEPYVGNVKLWHSVKLRPISLPPCCYWLGGTNDQPFHPVTMLLLKPLQGVFQEVLSCLIGSRARRLLGGSLLIGHRHRAAGAPRALACTFE